MSAMPAIYQRLWALVPRFLQRRINPVEESIAAFAAEAAINAHQGSVLDAGAGECRFRPLFGAARYVSVDTAVGGGDWDYSGLDVLADLAELPLPSASFDVALNFQVLEHVSDPAIVIAELHRVLRPGGQLFLTAPQGWGEHQQPHDYFRFTRWALERLCRQAGFETVEIAPMGGYFHYLGHRLTYIPKILFGRRRGVARLLLSPLELLSLAVFCGLGPLCCFYLDRFDKEPEFTLGYRCRAQKPP